MLLPLPAQPVPRLWENQPVDLEGSTGYTAAPMTLPRHLASPNPLTGACGILQSQQPRTVLHSASQPAQ